MAAKLYTYKCNRDITDKIAPTTGLTPTVIASPCHSTKLTFDPALTSVEKADVDAFMEARGYIFVSEEDPDYADPSDALTLGARWGQPLSGIQDGENRVFTLPEKALHGTYAGGEPRIRIYHNGRRLSETDDFTVSESGGPGTGYDTVTFVSFAPSALSVLMADYTKQL